MKIDRLRCFFSKPRAPGQGPKHHFMISLIIINILIIVAGGFLTPLWADFVHHIGGDLRTAGNAIAIFSVVIGIFTFIAGKLENEINRDEWCLVFSQAMFVVGYALYFFVHAPWQLYLLQIWLGLCGAIQSPAIYSLYQRYMPAQKRTTAWGLWNGFFNISMGVGALMSAYIAHAVGFVGVFSVMNIVTLLGLFIAIKVARDMRART